MIERICWVILAAACLRVGQWFPEAATHRQQQATVATGIYRPAPAVIHRLDCSVEGLRSCRAQQRMEKVRRKET